MAKVFVVIALVAAVVQTVLAGPTQDKSLVDVKIVNLGVNYTFVDDQPSLPFQSATELCKTGVWISYTGENYQFDFGGGYGVTQLFPYLGYSCHSDVYRILGSTRFIGSRSNFAAPSVTLFLEESLAGEPILLEGELSNISTPILSLVTIGTSVELFQDVNFQGDSICIDVTTHYWGGCTPQNVCWMFSWDDDLPWNYTAARSARMGCAEGTKFYMPKQKNTSSVRIH